MRDVFRLADDSMRGRRVGTPVRAPSRTEKSPNTYEHYLVVVPVLLVYSFSLYGLLVLDWRISDLLGLRRADLDLDAGTAITRAPDNKAKRDDLVKLHPVVLDHLRKLKSFEPVVFPWNHNRRTLHTIFAEIQEAAGIELSCGDKHEHTRFCHVYGFHDFRRAFATMNADKLTADALQKLMRHKSYQTTQGYLNMARQMDAAVGSLHVPDVLKGVVGG